MGKRGMDTDTHIHTHTHIHTRTHTHVNTYVCTHMHTHTAPPAGVNADSLSLLNALLVELLEWCSDYSSLVVELQETVLSWAEGERQWDAAAAR